MTEPHFITAWTPAEGIRRVTDGFQRLFGEPPAGVWMSPGRVNLIGEHTDYNGGLSLPVALPQATFLAARVAPAPGDVAMLGSAQGSADQASPADQLWTQPMSLVAPGQVKGWGAYAVGVIWALRQAGLDVPALHGYVDSCLPVGAGLSSSAALEAVFALASTELSGNTQLSRQDLAQACVEAENQIAGAPTGGMDQAAVLQAEPGCALLVDASSGATSQVPFDLASHGLELLIIDTRAPHALVDSEYGLRRQTCERVAKLLGVPNLAQIGIADLPAAIARLQELGSQAAPAKRPKPGAPSSTHPSPTDIETRCLHHARLQELGSQAAPAEQSKAGAPSSTHPSSTDTERRRLHHARLQELGSQAAPGLQPEPGAPSSMHPSPMDIETRCLRHVVTEIDRTKQFVDLLSAGRVEEVGPLLSASHASLRDDYRVSSPELDLAAATAEQAGALGARMVGGGFGGSALALVRAGSAPAIARAVAHQFAKANHRPPQFLMATPSPPATRLT